MRALMLAIGEATPTQAPSAPEELFGGVSVGKSLRTCAAAS